MQRFNPLKIGKLDTPKMGTLANSKVPDEMLRDMAFHQGLHCLQRQEQTSEKEI